MSDQYPFLYDGYGLADYIVRSIKDLDNSDFDGDILLLTGCSDYDELLSVISKWDKRCILHKIIDSALYIYVEWIAGKVSPEEFVKYYTKFINKKNIESGIRILNSDYDEENEDELYSLYSNLIDEIKDIMAESCFILLFSDRDFLHRLQMLIANEIKKLKKVDFPKYLKKDGVIFRPKAAFPSWLKKAVYFRDKGRCQLCSCDLSNTYIYNNINYDHMIALESAGNNDPTNIQLTCETCNKSKQQKDIVKKVPTQNFW